ncbi:Pol Polyprotein [Phytophthora megakarya]|uniref:Pol Polyprotein n=1 Tax=Phytophthora megakarya TaxID=4795 RepID=A0A225WCI3_9STRA|nr:Pol Polyprotein [Phytophthora megakarya]
MDGIDKELLLSLLRHYPTLLEPREGCPPMTTLGVEHGIHMGNEAPIKVRPRRHAQEELEAIGRTVDDMLRDRVVEESKQLNGVTSKGVYPLPRIDDTLDHLHGARRYTNLNMHSGYWQVPVALKDRDKTGFRTRKGVFKFVRVPFGLANTPGTFQRMVDAVLRGLT